MNALIDTCVIIDAMQSRKPFDEDAEAVFLSVANHRCEGFLTANTITILDTTGMDCQKALTSDISDYEDAVMVETADRAGIDCIVTRNIRDYVGAPMPVYTPEQFVSLLYEEEE